MKNFIMGIAMIMICSIFIVYQNDINHMQREQQYIKQLAEEAAATSALYIEEGDNDSLTTFNYANGWIKFQPNAGKKGFDITKNNLKLDDELKSEKAYYKNAFNITIYTFSCDKTYQKSVNGINTETGSFEVGDNISKFVDSNYSSILDKEPLSRQIHINYPTTICIIDAGKPNFRESLNLDLGDSRICKIGIYEYKSDTIIS